jgi:polysaccharide export outer membrane protein
MPRFRSLLILACSGLLACGCGSFMPTTGPSKSEIERVRTDSAAAAAIQIVDVDDAIARQLLSQRSLRLFSEVLGDDPIKSRTVGRGDVLEVSVWEAAPATLFGMTVPEVRGMPSTSRASTFPEQMVDGDGLISIPFAGRITAAGRSIAQIEQEIAARLKGKANQPEVLARVTRNLSSNATVVGEVTNSTRVPLTPGNERLLDALAAAAGVRQPVNKMTIQLTRGTSVFALPLETIIRDPRQNIYLKPGDVVTALFQSLSFTALGATGKNEEISFEAQGITLAQALARAGGLIDLRSNPRGVFIFRFEPKSALQWPRQPVATTPEGMVPVIYRIDLLDPNSFFVMQSFPMNDKDLLYVANAPVAELQKFLNVVFSVAYPVLTAVQVSQ